MFVHMMFDNFVTLYIIGLVWELHWVLRRDHRNPDEPPPLVRGWVRLSRCAEENYENEMRFGAGAVFVFKTPRPSMTFSARKILAPRPPTEAASASPPQQPTKDGYMPVADRDNSSLYHSDGDPFTAPGSSATSPAKPAGPHAGSFGLILEDAFQLLKGF